MRSACRILIAITLLAVIACGSDRGGEPSPFREMDPVSEVVVIRFSSDSSSDTIRQPARVDSILAFLRGSREWTKTDQPASPDSNFVLFLQQDWRVVGIALVGDDFIMEGSRAADGTAAHRALSQGEMQELRSLVAPRASTFVP
jgi:hypothetical protein